MKRKPSNHPRFWSPTLLYSLCIYVYIYIFIYSMCACMCIYTHTHTHTYIYIHTHTYIYIVMVIICCVFFFPYQETPLFDPGHSHLRFFHPAAHKVRCRPNFGLICLTSHHHADSSGFYWYTLVCKYMYLGGRVDVLDF